MDAFVAVNELADDEVGGDAGEDIGFFFGEAFDGDEEVEHFADGDLGGEGEVLIHAHDDEVGGSFGAGPFEVDVFADDEAEGTGERGFHGGDVDFAIALAGVAVADLEEGAFDVDGDVEGGAFDEVAVIHVAGVGAGGRAVELAGGGWRGDAHAAEEGVQGEGDVGGEAGDHVPAVEGDDAAVAILKILFEKAGGGAEAVVGPGDGEGDFFDVDFEDVAGFGAFDEDGAGEDVAAGAAGEGFIGDGFGDGAEGLGNLIGGDVEAFEGGDAGGADGIDGDDIAGFDGEDGFVLRPVIADDDGVRAGGKVVFGGAESGGGESGDGEEEEIEAMRLWHGESSG